MRFIKKHKYKLLTLMLSIVSIFTLFLGINKTYAYETDQLSYTCEFYTDNTYTQQINSTTINNINGILVNKNSFNTSFNPIIYFKVPNKYKKNYWFLMNFTFYNGTDFIGYQSNRSIYVRVLNDNLSINTNLSFGSIDNTQSFLNYPYINTIINRTYSAQQVNDTTEYTYGCLYVNGLVNYDFFITNFDIVDNDGIGLTQYYEIYYGQIESNYNQLLSDYDDLQDDYDTLESNYNTLNDDYEDLQDNYNQLNGNINNLNDFYKYGFLSLIKNGYTENNNVYGSFLEIIYTNRSSNVVNSIDYPITLNDISNFFGNTTFSLYDLSNHYIDIFDSDINSNDEYYVDEITLNLYFQTLYAIDYLDFTNHDFDYNMELFIRDDVNNYSLFLDNLDDTNTHIDSSLILSKNSNLKMFNVISFGRIVYNSDFLRPYISLNNVATAYYQSGFDKGYQSGLQQGKDSQQNTINDLNQQVLILNSRVENLEHLNQALNEQINSFNSDYNLNNLMWTIASTPFDSFKQIWNVNFFGVNISSVITGFLTGIIVLWIIKKFFL